MELTQEEIELVMKHRKEKDRTQRIVETTRHILQIALDYYTWMKEIGAGNTFSTFCDDFGYYELSRSDIYDAVTHAIEHAERTSITITIRESQGGKTE